MRPISFPVLLLVEAEGVAEGPQEAPGRAERQPRLFVAVERAGSASGPPAAPGDAWGGAVANRPDEQGRCWDCGATEGAQLRSMAQTTGLPAALTVVLCDGCALRLEWEVGDRLMEDHRRRAAGSPWAESGSGVREDCAPVAAVEDEASRAVAALARSSSDAERTARIVARQRLGARILTILAFWREKRF